MKLAERIAFEENAPRVKSLHLFWALLIDESRAAEIVAEVQFSLQSLPDDICFPFLPETISETEEFPFQIPTSSVVEQIVDAARAQSRMTETRGMVGTEHLLWGIWECDSSLKSHLETAGIEESQLLAALGLTTLNQAIEVPDQFQLKPVDHTQRERLRISRILDASENRCREGLRVVEDYTRFVLEDAHLSARLKTLRHEFVAAFELVNRDKLIAARDTANDVGTAISTPAENQRAAVEDVLKANCKRIEESLRTIEEFGKVLMPAFASKIERLRYDFYTLEQMLLKPFQNPVLENRQLYLLVTQEHCVVSPETMIRQALQQGTDIIQLREKCMPDAQFLLWAKQVREWTRNREALLIINDRPDLAALSNADGIHVGQDELNVHEVRQIVGPDMLVGVSTHHIDQARQAVSDGADYLGVGPVFPSKTKSFSEFAGLNFVREVAAEISLPWFAIGGITAENLCEVQAAGATRVAVSGTICRSENPGAVARELNAKLRST